MPLLIYFFISFIKQSLVINPKPVLGARCAKKIKSWSLYLMPHQKWVPWGCISVHISLGDIHFKNSSVLLLMITIFTDLSFFRHTHYMFKISIPFPVYQYNKPKTHPFNKQWIPHLVFAFVIYNMHSSYMNRVCVCLQKHDNLAVDISIRGQWIMNHGHFIKFSLFLYIFQTFCHKCTSLWNAC